MWEVGIQCSECGKVHAVHAEIETKPRSFGYRCPDTGSEITIRFVDPSVITQPWREVDSPASGSLPATSAETGGSFNV